VRQERKNTHIRMNFFIFCSVSFFAVCFGVVEVLSPDYA
jgi:hypothetical protein